MIKDDLHQVGSEPREEAPGDSGSVPAPSVATGTEVVPEQDLPEVSPELQASEPEFSAEEVAPPVEEAMDPEENDSEENDDPSNVRERVALSVDYAAMDREALVAALATLLETGDVERVRHQVESIKLHFYKKSRGSADVAVAPEEEKTGEEPKELHEEDPLEERMKALLRKFRDQRAHLSQIIEAERQANLEQKYQVIEELKELVNKNESIGDTFQQFRELQNRWRSIGLVPQSDVKNLWETYHHYVEIFYDYIKINKELRDLDLKKNLELKIQICEKAEELLLETSAVEAFNVLQGLHEQWREIGPVPQEARTEIWERFKTASSLINKKHQTYYEQVKEGLQKNLDAKTALCEKAEEILASPIRNVADWEKFSRELVEIQKVWFTIGYAPKKENNKIYRRFRAACNAFFTRKREYFSQSREEQHNNLQLKEDLCVQAEALKDSTDWKSASDDFIQMQKRWKEIGPVPRKHRDVIWKRFRSACDHFFENKSKHFNDKETGYSDNYKAKLDLIEQIKQFVPSEDMDENFERLKELQRQWSRIGFVPIKFKDKVQTAYRDAINKQFDALRLDEGKRQMMRYRSKIEGMSETPQSRARMDNERDRLFRRMQQLQNDIVIWENNVGFFSKSKNAESLIANVRRMIDQGKEELKSLEEKIRMIDKME